MANLIYGINAGGGFSDLISRDKALKELGLDVKDLSKIGNISDTISKNELHHLSFASGSPSQLIPENLIKRIDKYSKATEKIESIFEEKAGVNRVSQTGLHTSSTRGNLVINGPVGAPAIRYFSTELLNADTGDFEPLDISTSRVSSWSRTGSRLSFGGSLKVSSMSPARASKVVASDNTTLLSKSGAGGTLPGDTPQLKIGKIIINGLPQVTNITNRTFPAEVATHKIKVNINGTDYYCYAMKNIPLVFNGNFARTVDELEVANASGFVTDYRVITTSNGSIRNWSNNDQGNATGFLRFFTRGGNQPRVLEVYQKPANITRITAPGFNFSNFPTAEYTQLTSVNFSDNRLEKIPNFKTNAPSLTTLDLSKNLLGNSPAGSIPRLNRLTDLVLDRIPDSIRTLKLGRSFGTSSIPKGKAISADFKRKFASLQELDLSDDQNITSLDSPILPEMNPTCGAFRFANAIKCKTMPGVSQTQNILLHGTNASTAGIGTPSKKSLMKIRRALNYFKLEFDSPGLGYTASSTFSFTNRTLSKSGAASPQGIPFGQCVITTDSDGRINGGHFNPHTSKEEFVLQEITEVKRPDGTQKTRRPHTGGTGLSGYSPMGYYVDCGLFSSPVSNINYNFSRHNALVSSKFDAYMNPFSTVGALLRNGFTNTTIGSGDKAYIAGSAQNSDAAHQVWGTSSRLQGGAKNLVNFTITGSNLPIPSFASNTKIQNFEANSVNLLSVANLNEKIDFVKNVSKIQPGVNTPTAYNYQQLYTLYDSPQESPNASYGNVKGENGFYKFDGCSSLKNLKLRDSCYGGTLPKFSGNTSLQEVDLKNTHFNRTTAWKDGKHFPIDQFFSCRSSLKKFSYSKATNTFGNQNMGLAFGVKPNNSNEVDGWDRYPMPRATAADAAAYSLDEGDFPTDNLTALTHFTINTGQSGYKDPPHTYRMTGDVPTFKSSSSLQFLDLSYNGFSQNIDSPQWPRGHSRDADGNLVVSNTTGHFSLGYQYNSLQNFKIQQCHRLKGDVSFHKLANEDTTTNKGMSKLQFMYLHYNNFRRIVDFGDPADASWLELKKIFAADAWDCPNYNRASGQLALEPTAPTHDGDAERWLLDRRKDGTSHKYEYLLPTIKSSECAGFPKLRYIRLSNFDVKSARGPFIGFTPDGGDNMFEGLDLGNNSETAIDVAGHGFTKEAIVRVLKSIDTFYTNNNRRFGALKFQFQRGYDSPSGDDPLAGTGTPGVAGSGITDFRIYPYGQNGRESVDDWNPDSVYINPRPDRGPLQYNDVETNDLCRRIKDVHRVSLGGLDWSRIPDDITAPGDVILTLTGTGANQLHSTRQSGNQFNLYNWAPTQLVGTLQIGSITNPIDTDGTIQLRVYKINYLGQESQINAFTLDGTGDPLPSVKTFPIVLNIDGIAQDVNKSEPSIPYRLLDAVPQTEPGVDATNFTDRTQTFSIRVEVDSLRGVTVQTTQSYTFVNFVQSRTGATADADHANGEWKLELIS